MTNEIDELIRRILDGNAPEEEVRMLMRWMKEDESHREYFNMLKKVWNMTNGPKLSPERKSGEMERFVGYMHHSSLKKKKHLEFKIGRLWYRYAAVWLIPLSLLGIYFWLGQASGPVRVNMGTDINFGKPVLMMADGREVILEQRNGMIEGSSETGIQNDSLSGLNYTGAKLQENVAMDEEVYNTLSIPVGGFYQLSLSDGTKVWLNSMTELRFPVTFTGEEKKVYLTGEAYFEVVHDSEHPFIVATEKGIEVKVYGTEFNMNTYQEGVVQTVLVQGKVGIRANVTGQECMLAPKQLAEYTKETGMIRVKEVDPYKYIAWKDGKFVFEGETIEEIMERLRRWYDVEVFYENELLKQKRFTGVISRYENIEQVLHLIGGLATLHFEVKGNVVTVKKNK